MIKNKQRTITINKRLRPIRLAFMVKKEDKQTLHDVFRINTCLWGGIYNSIIPFFKKTPRNWENHRFKLPSASSILKGYLDSFEPDYLVVKDKKDKNDLSGSFFDNERILLFEDILNSKGDNPISFGVDITDIYWHLYNREFKFERRHPIKIFYPNPIKEIALFSACCFGEFPPFKEMEYIKKIYAYCFSPQEIQIDEDSLLSCLIKEGAYPLRITMTELQASPVGWRAEPSIFFLDANSWLDLVDYWNLRAVGWNVLPLPKQYGDKYIDICNEIIKRNYVPYRHNKEIMHSTTFICSRSSNMKEMELFAKNLTSPGQEAISLQHWWAIDKDHVERCAVYVKEMTEEVAITDSYMRFTNISPDFVERYGGSGKPRWINVIRFKDYYKQADFPSVLPSNLKDVHRVLRAPSLHRVWISREGINVPCNHFDWSHFWNVPTSFKIFEAWFKERGFEVALSGAGRILLKMVQSVNGIYGTQVFQHEEIIQLLNNMSHNAIEIEIEKETEDLSKSKVRAKTVSIKKWHDLLMKINHNSVEVAERHLQHLINYRILKCGINIQCPECMQHTWYGLDDLSERLVCERCLEEFDFPVSRPVPESDWHYRTIGPFSVENYAQGGYCVALTLRFLGNHHFSNEMTWIPSFKLKKADGGEIESDFGIFLSQGRGEISSPILIFGECKTYKIFTNENINRMKQIADAFPGSVIVFCTLRPTLSNREKTSIAKLARKGRNFFKAEQWMNPILILTGIELFSDFGPPDCWKDKGEPYSKFAESYRGYNGIQELCDVTQQMHLGMESYWEWIEKQRNKRMRDNGGREIMGDGE